MDKKRVNRHLTGCFHVVLIALYEANFRRSLMTLPVFFFCLRQDVAFFDANKTGLLVNRLTADIQEFKSSFKLVISQV